MINTFEILKERISFDSVANELGIEFNKSKKAICPFHDDKNPSLSLHSSGEYAHCFACDKTVDVIELEYKLGKHPNRWEACKALNERYALGLKFDSYDKEKADKLSDAYKLLDWYCNQTNKVLLKNEEALAFLKGKGITTEGVRSHKIGYVGQGWLEDKVTDESRKIALKLGLLKENERGFYDFFRNRIIFPVYARGRIASIWVRKFPDDGNEDNPKWVGLPISEFIPYKPLAWAENLNCQRCVIVEGVTDALAFLKVGIPACALLGKDVSEANRRLFERAKGKLYFALDPDERGKKSAYKLVKRFKGFIIDLGRDVDTDEVLAELGDEGFKQVAKKGIENAQFYLDAMIEHESDYEKVLREVANLEYEGEKEAWLMKFKKKGGLSMRVLKADLKKIEQRARTKNTPIPNAETNPIELLEEPTEIIHPAMHYDAIRGLMFGTVSSGKYLIICNGNLQLFSHFDARFSVPNSPRPLRFSKAGVERYLNGGSVNAVELYDRIHSLLCHYIHFEESWQPHVLTTWIIGTYLHRCFSLYPYLWIQSPIKRCGKTRLLELISELSFNSDGVQTAPSEAVLFRMPGITAGTLCWDEAEGLRNKEKGERIEVLNMAYKKGGRVGRCEGEDHEVRYFEVYRPIVITGIKSLPDTVADRSLKIELTRKRSEDDVGRLQIERLQPELQKLRNELHIFALQKGRVIVEAYKDFKDSLIPVDVDDRLRDGMEVLLSVAGGIVHKATDPLPIIQCLKSAAETLSFARNSEEGDVSYVRSISILHSQLKERDVDSFVLSSKEALIWFHEGGIEWVEKTTDAGKLLRNLGIRSSIHYVPEEPKRKRGYKIDRSKIDDLYARYCAVKKDAEKEDEKLSAAP